MQQLSRALDADSLASGHEESLDSTSPFSSASRWEFTFLLVLSESADGAPLSAAPPRGAGPPMSGWGIQRGARNSTRTLAEAAQVAGRTVAFVSNFSYKNLDVRYVHH